MRQKFVFVTAMAVCLTLAAVPALANERTIDRHGDRTKAGKGTSAKGAVTIEYSDDEIAVFSTKKNTSSATSSRAAAILAGVSKADRDTAIQMLQHVTTMDLESSLQNDAIRSTAYEMLAGQYSATPSRQVKILGMALQFASDTGRRSELERQITTLGGDVFALTFSTAGLNTYARRDPGADDSCSGATAVALPHSETMSIGPQIDHNWRSFDLVGAPDEGHFVSIETISDEPGTTTDDTDLALWDDCPADGGTMIAFNQDVAGDFTSRIDSDCLRPGTYYVEVGGFFDQSTPDNFDLEIQITGTCHVPLTDGFEPDNNRGTDAIAAIGLPNPMPSGNGWGRAHSEIQTRSLVNPDREDELGDFDHATFKLNQNSKIRMGTTDLFPTFFNGFSVGTPWLTDTIMSLHYEVENDYGGRCNQPGEGFLPVCQTDADCPIPLLDPIPGLPPCIPLAGQPEFGRFQHENPIATNDDRNTAGFDYGSELFMCLPSTAPGTPSLTLQKNGGDFTVKVTPWTTDPNGSGLSSLTFDYELQVKNEVGCLYESEPNNSFANDPDAYVLGTEVHAMHDFAVTNPARDNDNFIFDIDETSNMKFETFATEPELADTFMQLIVGPSDTGGFFLATDADDDSGEGLLSKIGPLVLPTADALLGNQTADANYIVRIYSNFVLPNYPYSFIGEKFKPHVVEAEPNDFDSVAQTVDLVGLDPFVGIGDVVDGDFERTCDYDTYSFTLTESTFITIMDLTVGNDTAIQITDCSKDVYDGPEDPGVFGCDDDGGAAYEAIIDGCLPAGTYCAQFRAWEPTDLAIYELGFSGVAGCTPDSPPQLNGDEGSSCGRWELSNDGASQCHGI